MYWNRRNNNLFKKTNQSKKLHGFTIADLSHFEQIDRLTDCLNHCRNKKSASYCYEADFYNLLKKTKQRPYRPCLFEVHRKYVDFREKNYLLKNLKCWILGEFWRFVSCVFVTSLLFRKMECHGIFWAGIAITGVMMQILYIIRF